MLQQLSQVSVHILLQIRALNTQLTDDEYAVSLELLSGNSISKHIRHILEIYDALIQGYDTNRINYDARKRDLLIEKSRIYALQCIDDLMLKLDKLQEDKRVVLEASYGEQALNVVLNTSITREVAYNIEHAIHHMAILQIAVKNYFPNIKLPADFGVAYATQAYQKQYVHA